MNNDGFLLFDSVLSLLIFTVIVLMLPALFYMTGVDQLSLAQLNFYRELYIMNTGYESSKDYIEAAKIVFEKAGIPCDERLKKICG